jgi:hypothetical protein
MPKKFSPLPLSKLASVDGAKCKYGKELAIVTGVVSYGGQGGWPATDDYEVHRFSFAAWRRDKGPVVPRELTILRPTAVKCMFLEKYEAGSIQKLKLLLSVDETRAIFADRIKPNAIDVDLQAVAEELKKPVTIKTKLFGVLKLNRQICWFEGKTKWDGTAVEITFETDANLNIDDPLSTAEALFNNQSKWAKQVKDFAVNKLLDLANDWNDERAKPIAAKEFLSRMKLTSISIGSEGTFEFWHNDGDLFYGHSIQIGGSLAKGLTRADIPG